MHVGAARRATPKADCVHQVVVGEHVAGAGIEPPQLTDARSIEAASGEIEYRLCKAMHAVCCFVTSSADRFCACKCEQYEDSADEAVSPAVVMM